MGLALPFIFGIIISLTSAQCPTTDCRNSCPYGFENDVSGCQICNCRLDPSRAPANSYRAGNCRPLYTTQQYGSCVSTCGADSECNSNEKCCSNGFCNRCEVLSEIGIPPSTSNVVKVGFCPAVLPGQQATQGFQSCSRDQDCPGTQKCCSNGVSLTCLYPTSTQTNTYARPGVCPPIPPGFVGSCVNECETDFQCNSQNQLQNMKCCSNGCGRSCMIVDLTGNYPGYPTYPYPYPVVPYPVPYPATPIPAPYPSYPSYASYPYGVTPYITPALGTPFIGPYARYPAYRYSRVVPNFFPRFAYMKDGDEDPEADGEALPAAPRMAQDAIPPPENGERMDVFEQGKPVNMAELKMEDNLALEKEAHRQE